MHLAMEMRPLNCAKREIFAPNLHAPPGHLCGGILCWAEARSRELRAGHCIDHISRLAAMGIWLHRACSVWRPGGTFTHGQPCQVKVNFQKARKRYLPLLASSRHITIPFWGKLIRGQKTYKAKNRPRAPVSSPWYFLKFEPSGHPAGSLM